MAKAVREVGVRQRADGQAQEGTLGARRQRDRVHPDAAAAFFRWGFPTTMWALPFAAFFLFSARSWVDGVGTRRTEAGRELWSQAGGFHRMLATDSAETRFDFGARKDLYTAYVPFAVAAGAAALWAKKYETTTGTRCAATGLVQLVVRRRRAGASPAAPAARASTASSRRCRRRSAPTPRRSRRRPPAVAAAASAVAAVAAAAVAEEEADHGEIPADHRVGAGGAGADRFRDGLQQDSRRRRPRGRSAVRHRRGADASRVADPRAWCTRCRRSPPTRRASSTTSPTPERR